MIEMGEEETNELFLEAKNHLETKDVLYVGHDLHGAEVFEELTILDSPDKKQAIAKGPEDEYYYHEGFLYHYDIIENTKTKSEISFEDTFFPELFQSTAETMFLILDEYVTDTEGVHDVLGNKTVTFHPDMARLVADGVFGEHSQSHVCELCFSKNGDFESLFFTLYTPDEGWGAGTSVWDLTFLLPSDLEEYLLE
jgi:hypothetical protein